MSDAVARLLLRGRIQTNALKHKPSTRAGVMITGRGGRAETINPACDHCDRLQNQ
jgi:hypothetical protein